MPSHLSPAQLARDLTRRDLTDPAAGTHGLQLVTASAVGALIGRWALPTLVHRGERIVTIADNYDALCYPDHAATRDERYSRYVDDHRLLRTHTSALVPAALRTLADTELDDVVIACPGIVFRRDAIDRLHTGTPHQLDLWRISRRPLTVADLDEMIDTLADALVPGRRHRGEPRTHPYTHHGRQVDVQVDDSWVEVWECGLAHPAVLAHAELAGWHGLALGMGLDRIFMLVTGVPDIRLLRSDDPRIASQMLDLEPYRPVSTHPPIRRDLSLAVDPTDDDETLGDRVRDALGDHADAVEQVTVLSRTPCSALPDHARARLGADADHDNALVRVELRHPDRTLTRHDANQLRDRIHAALHRGSPPRTAAATSPADAYAPRRSATPPRPPMQTTSYLVIRAHTSEYPEPITFTRGALLSVGERYRGPEGWDDWYFCETPGQRGGWVPGQIIEMVDETSGRAREDYTAHELDVTEGEILRSARTLNGWAWCERTTTSESGWVPLANLRALDADAGPGAGS